MDKTTNSTITTARGVATAIRSVNVTGEDAALLFWNISDFNANVLTYLAGGMADALSALFIQATNAGASLDDMARVRGIIGALAPIGVKALAIQSAGILYALSQEATILAGVTIGSRQDIERYIGIYNDAFDDAETKAADAMDIESYQAIVALHGAVIRDLTTRAWSLPTIVTYTFPIRYAAVALANRFYADASRNAELVAENKPVHPLFMPFSGRALSD